MKLSLLLALTFLSYGCSKATSKAEYKFKKAAGDGIAAKAGSISVSEKELYQGIEGELYDAEMKIFEIKFNRLKSILVERIMKADPNSKGLSNDEYMNKYINSQIKVSDGEIQQFIKDRKIPAQQVNPQVMEKIKGYLTMQKKASALETWLGEKVGKEGVTVFFQKPMRPSFDVKVGNAPFIGDKDAKVTIVEYSDFQCPYCAEGSKVLKKLKQKYGAKIKVAMKQFPLPFHTLARGASNAALCVNEQDTEKFWTLHDKFFASQDKLRENDVKETVKSLGVDMAKFEECFSAKKYDGQIANDIEEGKALGVKSTPTFYVNGQLVRGALPVEEFAEIIDQQLGM